MAAEIGPIDPAAAALALRPADIAPAPVERSAEAADEPAPAPKAERPTVSQTVNARLSIERDDLAGAFVYKILDADSGEIVRQFPQEEVLEVLRYFGQEAGLVADRRV